MRTPMETDSYFFVINLDVSWHVDDVAKDLASLSVGVAPHTPGQQAIQSAGDNQQCHVKVNLQTDFGRQGLHVKETHCIRERILDQQPLGIASHKLL